MVERLMEKSLMRWKTGREKLCEARNNLGIEAGQFALKKSALPFFELILHSFTHLRT